jgi:hypothetical protein
VSFSELAAHVYFYETGCPLQNQLKTSQTLIGVFQGRAIYLLFFRSENNTEGLYENNLLTANSLLHLSDPCPEFTGPRVVYAEGCTVPPERLAAQNVTFKQIPYQIAGL